MYLAFTVDCIHYVDDVEIIPYCLLSVLSITIIKDIDIAGSPFSNVVRNRNLNLSLRGKNTHF